MVYKTRITIIAATTTIAKTPKATRIRPKQQHSPPSSLHRSSRRRLFGLFALLSPSIRSLRRLGFRRLNPIPIKKHTLLPPSLPPSKPTLFLDLDETLIHSTPFSPPTTPYDFIVYPVVRGHVVPFYVSKRHGVDSFLEVAAESFEVVIFTAAIKAYASPVIDRLDPKGRTISHRLYRDSCKKVKGRLVKDLSDTGRDLGRVVIFDDNPYCYMLQPENAVPVRPFGGDAEDRELERLMRFFEKAPVFNDMRDAVKWYLSNEPTP